MGKMICAHEWVRFDVVTGGNEWEDFKDKHRKCSECDLTQKVVYVKREGEPSFNRFPEWQDTSPFTPDIPQPKIPTYDPKAHEGMEWSNAITQYDRS